MHSPPNSSSSFLFLVPGFTSTILLSLLSTLYSLLCAICPLQPHLLLCWTRPVQPVPPNTPQNKVPARRNRGLSSLTYFWVFSLLSLREKNTLFLVLLAFCQSFSSSILPAACHDQRHVFSSVRCGAQCLRFPLWWWPEPPASSQRNHLSRMDGGEPNWYEIHCEWN